MDLIILNARRTIVSDQQTDKLISKFALNTPTEIMKRYNKQEPDYEEKLT